MIADSEWNSAVGLAENQLGALNALLQLAGRWGMNGEQEDLLWRILRRFPDAVWAERDLERYYFAAGNTARLRGLDSGEIRFDFARSVEYVHPGT